MKVFNLKKVSIPFLAMVSILFFLLFTKFIVTLMLVKDTLMANFHERYTNLNVLY